MKEKQLILFGCSPFSRVLRRIIENEAGGRVAAYCMTEDYIKETSFDGLPVCSFETLDEAFGKENFEVLNTVSYRNMNIGREKIFQSCRDYGYEIASFIHPNACVNAEKMGAGNIVLRHTNLCYFSKIGDGNILCGVSIGHDSEIGSFNFMAEQSITGGFARIGNNCFIGLNACIGDSVAVGNHSLICAGATVVKDVPPNSIVGTPPPRIARGRPEVLGHLFRLEY